MTLDPQSAAFLASVKESRSKPWYDMPVDEARRTFDGLNVFGDAPDVDNTTDTEMGGVSVRIYHVSSTNPRPAVVYFHGGGWVLGGLESHDALCRRLAIDSDATVISVDYRKPPEHPFPAAFEDCYTVCDVLAVDNGAVPTNGQMVVAGDSAGGNLAAAVSLMSVQRGGPNLAGQVLIYPVIDSKMSTGSYEKFATDHGLTAETMAWFWDQYVGSTTNTARSNPLASPSYAPNLAGMPPAHLVLAEYDVLVDEGKEFAKRLEDAGVPTSVSFHKGMLHGFFHFASLFDRAIPASKEVGQRCREMLSSQNQSSD